MMTVCIVIDFMIRKHMSESFYPYHSFQCKIRTKKSEIETKKRSFIIVQKEYVRRQQGS